MPPQLIFLIQLVLGYVACLLYFGVYVLPDPTRPSDRSACRRPPTAPRVVLADAVHRVLNFPSKRVRSCGRVTITKEAIRCFNSSMGRTGAATA